MHGNLIDYMLLGDMGHWDMQRALRIGQGENFIKVFFLHTQWLSPSEIVAW